jgi:hypothetical protein
VGHVIDRAHFEHRIGWWFSVIVWRLPSGVSTLTIAEALAHGEFVSQADSSSIRQKKGVKIALLAELVFADMETTCKFGCLPGRRPFPDPFFFPAF